MKKLLSIITCLVLTMCVILSAGCNSSVFDGNYKEVKADEITAYANELEKVQGGEELDYNSGLKTDVKLEAKMGSLGDMNVEVSLNAIAKDNKLQMSGKSNVKMTSENMNVDTKAEVYYGDGKLYTSAAGQKIYQELPVDEVIDEMTGDFTGPDFGSYSLSETIEEFSANTDVKFYLEKNEDGTKVKISIPNIQITEDGITMKLDATVYMIYNAKNHLIGYKMDAKMNYSVQGQTYDIKMYTAVEPWSGSISAPSDLADYKKAGLFD